MSQTTGDQYLTPSATFNEDLFRTSILQVQQDFAILGLLGGLYGVLFVLSVLSIWAFTRRKDTGTQPNALPLCLTILALFMSTTAYMVTCMLSCQYIFLKAFISSGYALWSYNVDIKFPDTLSQLANAYDYTRLHSCASTASIAVNITLGDAIVCWRACVVWYHHRAVRAVLSIFLLATFVLGVADTAWGCRAPYRVTPFTLYSFIPLGTSFEGLPIGLAACALSLATNLLATLLVGYKAWECRKRLWGYFVAGPGRTQVQKLLALLVESGAVYCALWGVVVAFQIGAYRAGAPGSVPVANGFLNVFNVFMCGALVPLIAIYPAAIIVLVALDRSHMEKGLTQLNVEDMDITVLTPHIPVIVDVAQTSVHDGDKSHWRQREALVVSERDIFRKPGDGSEEDVSIRRARSSDSEERKAEEFV